MTCGPYRPVTLLTYSIRLEDIHVRNFVDFQPDGGFSATMELDAALSGTLEPSEHMLLVEMLNDQQSIIKSKKIPLESKTVAKQAGDNITYNSVVQWTNLEREGVQLWWPVGYGSQTLYKVKVSLLNKVPSQFPILILKLADVLIFKRLARLSFQQLGGSAFVQ